MLTAIDENTYQCKFCKSVYNAPAPSAQAPSAASGAAPTQSKAGGGADVYDKNINGILELSCRFSDFGCAGSGLLINKDGYAITNAHVVSTGREISKDVKVRICGRQSKAKIINLGDAFGGDGPGMDLALIKLDTVPSDATPISFAEFEGTRNGEQVYVIGNSLGDGTCITSGIVSDKSRELDGHRLLMTDCAINGGNSGGPIFNSAGDAIGVIVSSRIQSDGSATEGMNYAIPADIVEEFICGDHIAVNVEKTMRHDSKPRRYASCPVCSAGVEITQGESCKCPSCSKTWTHRNIKK